MAEPFRTFGDFELKYKGLDEYSSDSARKVLSVGHNHQQAIAMSGPNAYLARSGKSRKRPHLAQNIIRENQPVSIRYEQSGNASTRAPTKPMVFLQDRVDSRIRQKRFSGLMGAIRCDDPAHWNAALARIETEQENGHTLAGFVSYEAGYLLEQRLLPLLPQTRNVPLLWMGIFENMEEEILHPTDLQPIKGLKRPHLTDLAPEIDKATYTKKVEAIKSLIEAGDVYQANFTYQTDLTLNGHPLDYFLSLTHAQPVPYAAYIDTGVETILSLSPELFFEVEEGTIRSKPMKGTARRGRTNLEDEKLASTLANDPKERAENLMILDLMRNDVSRIAKPGTVKVPERFQVERYRTVHQMTSTVTADLNRVTSVPDIFKAIFPCGSITGAPKVRAMEVIADLEESPRGVYCGAIGHIAPDGSSTFNVAIRTLTLKQETADLWNGRIGVGGGIVYDSTPEGEYDECQVKLAFLTRQPREPFSLIETMLRREDGSVALLDEHLNRLVESARYFDIAISRANIEAAIKRHCESCGEGRMRVRLLLAQDGGVSFTSTPQEDSSGEPIKVCKAKKSIDSRDLFVFHKTTRREHFDEALVEARKRGFEEVLFFNENNEITEGAISNVFLEKNGNLLTPHITCGLLPGTLRARLIETGRAREAVLTERDLARADAIYFGNSVSGLRRVSFGPIS